MSLINVDLRKLFTENYIEFLPLKLTLIIENVQFLTALNRKVFYLLEGSFKCKNVENFTFTTEKFYDRHHTNQRA